MIYLSWWNITQSKKLFCFSTQYLHVMPYQPHLFQFTVLSLLINHFVWNKFFCGWTYGPWSMHFSVKLQAFTEAYLVPWQTSTMELFANLVNGKSFCQKHVIINVWQGPKYASNLAALLMPDFITDRWLQTFRTISNS